MDTLQFVSNNLKIPLVGRVGLNEGQFERNRKAPENISAYHQSTNYLHKRANIYRHRRYIIFTALLKALSLCNT